MTNTDQILATIAEQHLGIPTLEPRNSDCLDFHNVAVWSVTTALKAAFGARAASASNEAAAALLTAAQLVVSRWEKGDLAEAVRILSDAVEKAKVA